MSIKIRRGSHISQSPTQLSLLPSAAKCSTDWVFAGGEKNSGWNLMDLSWPERCCQEAETKIQASSKPTGLITLGGHNSTARSLPAGLNPNPAVRTAPKPLALPLQKGAGSRRNSEVS